MDDIRGTKFRSKKHGGSTWIDTVIDYSSANGVLITVTGKKHGWEYKALDIEFVEVCSCDDLPNINGTDCDTFDFDFNKAREIGLRAIKEQMRIKEFDELSKAIGKKAEEDVKHTNDLARAGKSGAEAGEALREVLYPLSHAEKDYTGWFEHELYTSLMICEQEENYEECAKIRDEIIKRVKI